MAKGDYLELTPHPTGELARLVPPPDGTYTGTWTACFVTFDAAGTIYQAKMSETAVRGSRECVVTVAEGRIRVR